MRNSYHDDLNDVVDDLVRMADLVRTSVSTGTRALLEADIRSAEQVISEDESIDETHNDIESRCFSLLARQAPTASDLRTVVSALRMVTAMERMGDLAAHVAKIARMRFPERAVPDDLQPNFERMAKLADQMIAKAGDTLRTRDVAVAAELATIDEEMDELRRDQFRILLDDDWAHGVEAAVDVALLGRYYERIADHAVSLGRRVAFVVTGEKDDRATWSSS